MSRSAHRHARPLLAAIAVLAAACDSATAPDESLARAQRQWARRAPAAYAMTIVRDCFCETGGRAVVVEVRGDSVQARRWADDGSALPARLARGFPAVEGLFAELAYARARPVASFRARYHPTLGYPVDAFVDYDARLADEEGGFRVLRLERR